MKKYFEYLQRLASNLNIRQNIVWLGQLALTKWPGVLGIHLLLLLVTLKPALIPY